MPAFVTIPYNPNETLEEFAARRFHHNYDYNLQLNYFVPKRFEDPDEVVYAAKGIRVTDVKNDFPEPRLIVGYLPEEVHE